MDQRQEAGIGTRPATSSSKDSSSCPICLEPIREEAFLDCCFHAFCYSCIAKWTKHVSNRQSQTLTSIMCPLCKRANSSIVYGLSGTFFQRHYVNKDPESGLVSKIPNFLFCTLFDSLKFSASCHKLINSDGNAMQLNKDEAGVVQHKFDVHSYWKNRRYSQRNQYLQSWLTREIQTLLQEEDVDVIMHHILGVLDTFFKRQQQDCRKLPPEEKRREFKQVLCDAGRPFIGDKIDRFVDELELFLASSLNIEAYDAVYMKESARVLASTPGEDCTEDEHDLALGDPRFRFFAEDLDK